jgi:hypothetical protein
MLLVLVGRWCMGINFAFLASLVKFQYLLPFNHQSFFKSSLRSM